MEAELIQNESISKWAEDFTGEKGNVEMECWTGGVMEEEGRKRAKLGRLFRAWWFFGGPPQGVALGCLGEALQAAGPNSRVCREAHVRSYGVVDLTGEKVVLKLKPVEKGGRERRLHEASSSGVRSQNSAPTLDVGVRVDAQIGNRR